MRQIMKRILCPIHKGPSRREPGLETPRLRLFQASTRGRSLQCGPCNGRAEKRIERAAQQTLVTSKRVKDTSFWNSVKYSGGAASYQVYLEQFPSGSYVNLASERIRGVKGRGKVHEEAAPIYNTSSSASGEMGNCEQLSLKLYNWREIEQNYKIGDHISGNREASESHVEFITA